MTPLLMRKHESFVHFLTHMDTNEKGITWDVQEKRETDAYSLIKLNGWLSNHPVIAPAA